ncbi:MAG TPA: hypothetical protein VLZ77_13285 [Acidimicrobiales bacterium]|nr:hypothetical protein [Acidimicrobiales bacterium]
MPDRFDVLAMAMGAAGPGPAPGEGAPAVSLHTHARLVGAYQWMERRLFEVLGSWVSSEPVAEARIMFDLYSQQHAWHAELFAERLPALDQVDPDTLTVPPSVEVDRVLSALAGELPAGDAAAPPDPDGAVFVAPRPGAGIPAGGTLLRLVGLGRVVLPRLAAGYGLHLRRASTLSDAPVRRSLRMVLHDEIEQWRALEALTQALVRRPHDVAVVSAHQQRLEELVAATGVGLVPWPDRP